MKVFLYQICVSDHKKRHFLSQNATKYSLIGVHWHLCKPRVLSPPSFHICVWKQVDLVLLACEDGSLDVSLFHPIHTCVLYVIFPI